MMKIKANHLYSRFAINKKEKSVLGELQAFIVNRKNHEHGKVSKLIYSILLMTHKNKTNLFLFTCDLCKSFKKSIF